MPPLLASVLFATLTAACISNPARGTTPTGESLRVRFNEESGTYQEQQVTGTDNVYNADGESVGSVEHTQAVTKEWSRTDVTFYQGNVAVDEQDYYHLAKDRDAVDEIKAARAQASRDMTIGFPLAIGAAVGSTLAAIGTFGDSSAIRYGVSTGLSLAALGGIYLAMRGLKTHNKRPLLDAERAISHANVVERCFHGQSCTKLPGGARAEATPQPPATLSMRAKSSAWSGTWTGRGNSTMQTKDGRSTRKSSSVEIGIEQDGDTLSITLEPKDAQKCTLEADVDGERAELRAGQTCRRREKGGEIALTVRDGSTLSLDDGELKIALSLDLELTDTSKRKPRTAHFLGSMDATATRAR